jgi:hypothetical protein
MDPFLNQDGLELPVPPTRRAQLRFHQAGLLIRTGLETIVLQALHLAVLESNETIMSAHDRRSQTGFKVSADI